MKQGITEAKEYLNNMRSAVGTHLISTEGVYAGREGHLRFARECGYALNDFDEEGQKEILENYYQYVYVTGCMLKPILNNKDLISEMLKGKNR